MKIHESILGDVFLHDSKAKLLFKHSNVLKGAFVTSIYETDGKGHIGRSHDLIYVPNRKFPIPSVETYPECYIGRGILCKTKKSLKRWIKNSLKMLPLKSTISIKIGRITYMASSY